MPIIPFIPDVSALQGVVTGIKAQTDAVDDKIKQQSVTVMQTWAIFTQLATTSLSLLSRAAEGTAAQIALQKISAGLALTQAELAVFMTMKQAAAMYAVGTPWSIVQGGLLTGITAGMQIGVIAAEIQRQAANEADLRAQEIVRQLEAYES